MACERVIMEREGWMAGSAGRGEAGLGDRAFMRMADRRLRAAVTALALRLSRGGPLTEEDRSRALQTVADVVKVAQDLRDRAAME